MGLANYYRHFIRGFAHIAKPLHELTKKGKNFSWTSECGTAFSQLKSALTSAPVLVFPDFTRPFILDTDASDSCLGGILSQEHEGRENICYDSRLLSKEERQYCVTRKELLTVLTFTAKFRPYLLGRLFELRTDHGSLVWLHNFRQPEGQLARWIKKLQEFEYKIVHCKGKTHGNADAMSRMYCNQRRCPIHSACAWVHAVQAEQKDDTGSSTVQLKDTDIGPILDMIKDGQPKPDLAQVRGFSPAQRALCQQWEQLRVVDGTLYCNFEDADGHCRLQLIVPMALRSDILKQMHEASAGGHLGEEKTLYKLCERFYWLGHQKDTKNWCRTCKDCAERKAPGPKSRASLMNLQTRYPTQMVGIDLWDHCWKQRKATGIYW